MKIHIYEDTLVDIPWVSEYKELYAEHLQKIGVEVERITSAENCSGYLLLGHISELHRYRFEKDFGKSDCRLIMQMNGTSLLRYNRHIDRKQEQKDLEECWLNITANDEFTRYARKEFGLDNIFTVGFPVKDQEPAEKEKGLFCIAGKLDPSKLVTLSIKIAMDNPDFKRLVICYPKASRELVKYYPKHEKISYLECDHDALIDVLKKSEYFVVASLEDTTNLTHVEAIKCGCKTIWTDHGEILPYYQTNLQNIEKFSAEYCAKTLEKTIKYYENENL